MPEILKGHISPETAYVVNDYPYGFRLRCKIRYWMEHDTKRGTRFVSQTTNPKIIGREHWNKPKASTYAYIAGCMYLNELGHVTWTELTEYKSTAECQHWFDTYRDGLTEDVTERVEEWIRKKTAYDARMVERKVATTR